MSVPKRDFALEVFFSEWEFAAKYHLTASDAESLSLRELLALASPADRVMVGAAGGVLLLRGQRRPPAR